tara:strand:+ start:601 stop:969 length:369 start_codon:yes stop_codon:yes gene_type:complete
MKDNFNVHEWNKNRYLERLQESDDPTMGAELEGDPGERVEENQSSIISLSKYFEKMHPDLDFYVRDEPYFDRIDVVGSEQDKLDFGGKYHGKKFGEYEVFAIDDDERGEIVRIVKSDSIMRG